MIADRIARKMNDDAGSVTLTGHSGPKVKPNVIELTLAILGLSEKDFAIERSQI